MGGGGWWYKAATVTFLGEDSQIKLYMNDEPEPETLRISAHLFFYTVEPVIVIYSHL